MGKKRLLVVGLILSIGLNIVAFVFFLKNRNEVQSVESFNAMQMRYPLLSKRILNEFPQDILINFLDLRTALHNQVSPYGDNFGFYFEYLPTGTSIGINANSAFHAASLFKVPVIMAYYYGRERLNLHDDPTLTIMPNQIDKQFGSLWRRGAGTKIKASEAVELTLVESDNTAAKAIVPYVNQADFNAVYEGLDVNLQTDNEGALISAKNYSSILKALYFSSLLNRQDSEEILDLLTKSKFQDKIVAGIPQDVLVAHKIGDFNDDKGQQGYRDCGIVYVPRRPYVLCMFQ
jgi:beta-lactamase class A